MPFQTSIGNNNARRLSDSPTFDPEMGWAFQETWEGSEDAIKALLSQFAGLGWRGRAYPQDGPIWRAEFTRVPTSDETGLPEVTDQWEFDTEFVQESIYANPQVHAAIGNDEDVAAVKAVIEQTIADKGNLTEFRANYLDSFGSNADGNAEELFTLRNRGQQATEIERTVLRRVRTLAITSAQRAVISAAPRIYSTAALIDFYDIPALIANAMPADPPTAPAFTVWAWKKRRDSSVFIPQLNKLQENREFVFAAWAEMTYQLFV